MSSIVCTLPGRTEPVREALKRHKVMDTRIGSVTGFVLYYLIETAEGSASVTVCEDPLGCDASTKRAETWLRQNVPDLKPPPPHGTASEGAFPFAQASAMV